MTYTISVTSTDSAGCTPSTFALQAAAPAAGWQRTFALSSLTVLPGATASTTLQVTSPPVPAGPYTLVASAINTADATLWGSTPMLYMVAAAGSGGGTSGTFTDKFDRPDAPALGNGWIVVTGSLLIQAGEARNTATAPFNLAVQPAIAGATQTVSASFASSNNNTSPLFGVVLRYQDPQNYYVCYRQTGGRRPSDRQGPQRCGDDSQDRRAPESRRERVLHARLPGDRQASSTVQHNGKTLTSVSDPSFTSGTVGYRVKSKVAGSTAASHRTDNFTVTVQ